MLVTYEKKNPQDKLALNPLVSLLNHSKFKVAREMGNFERWIKTGLERFCTLGAIESMYSEEILMHRLGVYPGKSFQYGQVKASLTP